MIYNQIQDDVYAELHSLGIEPLRVYISPAADTHIKIDFKTIEDMNLYKLLKREHYLSRVANIKAVIKYRYAPSRARS